MPTKRGGVCGHLWVGGGVKDLADIRKLVLVFIIPVCFVEVE